MPPPDNDIDEDRLHTWMGSGGGTSISSVSAPHRSQDSIASPTGEQIQTLQDDSESTDMWQSGTGRGIRAHETIAGIYIYLYNFLNIGHADHGTKVYILYIYTNTLFTRG